MAPSRKFTKFIPIPSARIPILKCLHIRTGYNCDLNFSDSFGVYNSPILGALLNFDERVYDMAIILKYWMKVHDLSGTNKLSNYALLWLLIFYLQTLKSPIIPPIKTFQMNVPPYYINDMNFAFNQNLPNSTRNRQRQTELLLGFFEFYKAFDFETQIICPLHAKAFQRKNLIEEHPGDFARYTELLNRQPERVGFKFNKVICIQDPFDICQTIPGPIAKQNFLDFRHKLDMAAIIFKRELQANGENGNLLLSIFNREAFVNVPAVNEAKMVKSSKSSFFVKLFPSESDLVVVRRYLLKTNNPSSVITAVEIKAFWAKSVIKHIIDMFTNIFCLDVSSADSDTSMESLETVSKSSKVDGQSDVHTNDLSKSFEIAGTKDVFYGRKQQKIHTAAFIRNEMEISKKRFEGNQMPINLKAKVKLWATSESADFVSVEFDDLVHTKKNNFFKGFQSMFSSNVHHYLKGYVLEFQTNELAEAQPAVATSKKNAKGQQTNDKEVDFTEDTAT